MSDIKIIKVTANIPPEANISVKELSTGIDTPITEVKLQNIDTVGFVVQDKPTLKVELSGYGESVTPEPVLFQFAQDISILTDVFTKDSFKVINDDTILTEYLVKLVDKVFAETTITSDVFSRATSFNRVIDEGPYASFDYMLSADGLYNYTRSTVMNDQMALTLSKPFSEDTSVSEYKQANLQNYFDSTYVLEDFAGINYII